MKNIIPASAFPLKNKDIKIRINRRYVIGVVVTVLWIAAVYIAVGVFNVGANSFTGSLSLIASVAVPVFWLRPYRVITDRSRTGVVESVTRQNKPLSVIIGFLERDADTVVPVVTVIIECEDGNITTKVYRLKRDHYQYAEALADYYKAGTLVNCYRGIKYPKKEDNTIIIGNIAHRLCIVCGNFDDRSHTICRHCRSTFVE